MENKTKMEVNPNKNQSKMLSGMFSDRRSTEDAYNTLYKRGYNKEDINLMMSEDTRNKHFSADDTEVGSKAMEGAKTGSAIGGVLGAAVGIIAAIGTSVAIPGLGLIVAGPLAVGILSAGAGGVTGGVIGALIGSGFSEERAKLYESGVNDGKIVMGVHPRNQDDAKYFQDEWNSLKAEQVYY